MTADGQITAFYSYARGDWDAWECAVTASQSHALDRFFKMLESFVRQKLGRDKFATWIDQKDLRDGDHWAERVREALSRVDLLFIFLSPHWLDSPHCNAEFNYFHDRFADQGDRRIFVFSVEGLLDEQQSHHADMLARLKAVHSSSTWHDLLNENLVGRCREVAASVAAQIGLIRSEVGLPKADTRPTNDAPRITSTDQARPLVSGNLMVPSQGGVVDGRYLIWFRLLFRAPASVATRYGRIVFGATGATLRFHAVGGEMLPHREFPPTHSPVKVVSLATGDKLQMNEYSLQPPDTQLLQGNVLYRRDEYVPVFEVTRNGEQAVTVSATIELEYSDVQIDQDRSEAKVAPLLQSNDDERRKHWRERLGRFVLDETGKIFAVGDLTL